MAGLEVIVLTIRKAQMAVFERIAGERFAKRLVPHIQRMWSAQCAGLTVEQIAARASDAVTRAVKWGLESELDVARFVDLTFVFGSDFDQSQKCGWAGEILRRASIPASERMAMLWNRARAALRDPNQTVELPRSSRSSGAG